MGLNTPYSPFNLFLRGLELLSDVLLRKAP